MNEVVTIEKYFFSGSLTQAMHDYLVNLPDFEPIDILISQLDRHAIEKNIQWKREGFCRCLFIDSGAYSVHTGMAKVTTDEYIEYLNSIDDDIDIFAQLDRIPGTFRVPKSPEDYVVSAKESWENYLYMRERVKSPQKLMPVMHQGESMDHLKFMIEWKDENGKQLDYVGISPSNDRSQNDKDVYLRNCEDIIKASTNPHVKTHLYGMTSLESLSKYHCYSADSISHRLIAGYCKVLSPTFGVVSVTKKPRTVNTKSNQSFIETADEYNLEILRKEVEACNLTMEEIEESSAARVAFTMHSIQVLMNTKYKYSDQNLKRPKKFF